MTFDLLFLVAIVAIVAGVVVYLHRAKQAHALELAKLEAARGAPGAPPAGQALRKSDRCEDCALFDLTEGQALIALHPRFVEAASHLPPVEMGRQVDEEGNALPRDIPARTQWHEFGLCIARQEILWGGQDRRRRLRVLDTAPGCRAGEDCWSDSVELREQMEDALATATAKRAAEEEARLQEMNPFGKRGGQAWIDDAVADVGALPLGDPGPVAEADVMLPRGTSNIPPPEPETLGDPEGGSFTRDPVTQDLVHHEEPG